MKFQFDSLSDFLNMAGHGEYVWSSYAVAVVTMFFLVMLPVIERKRFTKQVRNNAARKAALKKQNEVIG